MAEVRQEAQRPAFAQLLRSWREHRKLSQLELALAASISQRHLSFLELGRARPSRAMALQLAEALDVPLRERNALLLAAGFAAMYRERALDEEAMQPVRAALDLILAHHEPNPAAVVDRSWNLLKGNGALHRVFSLAGDLPSICRRIHPEGGINLLRLTLHPQGFRPLICNWAEAAAVILARTRREAQATGDPELQRLLREVLHYPGIPAEWHFASWDAAPPPVLPLSLEKDGLRLDLFSMVSTFGTPQDITTDELRVESFFPADDATAALLRALAHTSGQGP